MSDIVVDENMTEKQTKASSVAKAPSVLLVIIAGASRVSN